MARVNIAVATAQKPAAFGSVAGGFRFGISGAAGTPAIPSQISATPVAQFDNVAAGDYTATCVAIDDAGNPLLPVADFSFSQAFTVAVETVLLDAPVGMTINVVLGAA